MPQSAARQVSLADALARLGDALDVLSGVGLAAVTDAELVEGVLGSRRLLLRLRCLDAAIAGRFDTSTAWAGEARSVTGWLAQHGHAPVGETQARLRLAQDAARHRVMGAAVAAGEVAVEHLRELATTHRRLPALARELDAVEDVITDYARQATPAQLRGFLDQLARSIAPDVVDDAEKQRLEDRAHLTVTELLDGWVAVSAMLPPELGGRFLTALRALMLPAVIPATTDGGTGAAAATMGAGDQSRPLRQRMLDALDRMLDFLADTRLDGTGFPRLRGHLPHHQRHPDPRRPHHPARRRHRLAADARRPGSGRDPRGHRPQARLRRHHPPADPRPRRRPPRRRTTATHRLPRSRSGGAAARPPLPLARLPPPHRPRPPRHPLGPRRHHRPVQPPRALHLAPPRRPHRRLDPSRATPTPRSPSDPPAAATAGSGSRWSADRPTTSTSPTPSTGSASDSGRDAPAPARRRRREADGEAQLPARRQRRWNRKGAPQPLPARLPGPE